MTRRLNSESKLPGMTATREWVSPDNLSEEARRIGKLRRLRDEEIRNAERQIENIEGLIRTVDRARRRKLK